MYLILKVEANIGLGLVETKFSDIGTKFNIEAYDELVNSEIIHTFMEKTDGKCRRFSKKFYQVKEKG